MPGLNGARKRDDRHEICRVTKFRDIFRSMRHEIKQRTKTKKRPVGRPRIHKNDAEKARAYRERVKQRRSRKQGR
jgi:hypothetical protein